MGVVDLLQQVGLSKYQAEAYVTLLAEGPLTGYELGKRSAVPLSRSYEIVERLTQAGLALVQPGDPPRYRAVEPAALLRSLRAAQGATLAALEEGLATLPGPASGEEFWVVRGRAGILDQARLLLAGAERIVALAVAPEAAPSLAEAVTAATARGCRVESATLTGPAALLLLLVDERAGLAGALTPADRCQAVVGAHPALIGLLRDHLVRPAATVASAPAAVVGPAAHADQLNRIAWEDRKQRRLWRLATNGQAA